ncbi:MAG: hypothetical protein J2P36_01685 [Ktedonobacteraceae bacterium]|nr:hypothetical protein [Ktedonobacteraceae bacterium]
MARDETRASPGEHEYHLLRAQLHDQVAANLNLPTAQDLKERLGPHWQEEAARQDIAYWPEITRLNDAASLGRSQTLNDRDWVSTCMQVAAAQASEVHRLKENYQRPDVSEPASLSESDLVRLCEKHGIGFTESKTAQWIAEGLIVVADQQAVALLDGPQREHISKSAINEKIEQHAHIIDPGEANFHMPEIQKVGELGNLPLIRRLDHQKIDPTFSRVLITAEHAASILDRCGRSGLLEDLHSRGAILTGDEVRQTLRSHLEEHDKLPETGDLFRVKFLLGFVYPEDMQRLSTLDRDGVTLEWRANLTIQVKDPQLGEITKALGFSRDAVSGTCTIKTGDLMDINRLGQVIEEHGAAAVVAHFPLEGDPFQIAAHTTTVHRFHWDGNQKYWEGQPLYRELLSIYANDSGPKGAIERVGTFPTREGIMPIAGFDGARNKSLTPEQMDHWLCSSNELQLGNQRVFLSANILIPNLSRYGRV